MMRRLLTSLAALLLLLTLAVPAAYASETDETTSETTEETTEETTSRLSTATSGTCGKNITWRLDDHTLIITGSGAMDAGCPWEFYKDTIHAVIFQGPVTTVGDEAFYSCNNLSYVDFGSSLVEIGYQAFYSCNALEAIRLPASFRKFGPECFRDCSGLQVVYCDGPMPSFKASCLYTDHTVQIFYPNNAPWPQEEVARLMSNFGSRLYVTGGTPEVLEEYLSEAEFTAPETQPIPETTEATVPETTVPETTVPETTVPETTAPPTVEPTVSVTSPVSEEPEEAVFQLESEPLFVTEPDRTPEPETNSQPVSSGKTVPSGIIVWILIAAAVVTGILILALLIRMIVHSSGRYED